MTVRSLLDTGYKCTEIPQKLSFGLTTKNKSAINPQLHSLLFAFSISVEPAALTDMVATIFFTTFLQFSWCIGAQGVIHQLVPLYVDMNILLLRPTHQPSSQIGLRRGNLSSDIARVSSLQLIMNSTIEIHVKIYRPTDFYDMAKT